MAEDEEETPGELGVDEPSVGLPLKSIARQLAALPEAAMRSASLGERIAIMSPKDAAWLLDGLATAGRAGGPPFDIALMAAVDLAGSDRIDYEMRKAIFESADRLSLEACKELLFSATLDAGDLESAGRPRALVPGGRPLTLGERKSLARSWNRQAIEQLMLDPHHDVIALLLQNTRLTEDDVLRLATARRARSQALQLIYDHPRWKVRARVRRALLRNPNLAEASALRLVGLLNRSELQDLRNDNLLPDRVLHAVRRRLRPPS